MSIINQGISPVRGIDWLYRSDIQEENLGMYGQDMPSKMLNTQGRRVERRFTAIPSTNKERVRSQGKIQSVNPSSLWPKTQQNITGSTVPTITSSPSSPPSSPPSSETRWMPRQPSKITTTKPDLDLLFSLFAVIESEEKELDSELETSLSPHSSPNVSHLNYPVIPSQDALSQYTYQQVDSCSSSCSPSSMTPQQVYMSESLSPSSYITDEDYPATLEHDVVNTCDGMTWLPPVFDNKLMEKAVPFSELVDVFCM